MGALVQPHMVFKGADVFCTFSSQTEHMGHADSDHSSKRDPPPGLGESKSDKELSSEKIDELNLPTDIRWFYSKEALFAAHRGTVKHPIAFDYRTKSGKYAKIYGSVSEPWQYLEVIQRLSPEYRCGYEVIQPHIPAKLYIDIENKLDFECTGHEDPTIIGKRFQMFRDTAVKELAEYLKPLPQLILDILGKEARIIVLDSCRLIESNKIFKMSFHVTVQNIMFQNNDADSGKTVNQQRKAVMLALLKKLPETRNIAPDPAVYSSFQNFRLPHCFKMGQPEGRLQLQPELCSPGMSEQEMLLGSLITHVASDALIIKNISLYPKLAELCPQLPLKPLVAARGTKRPRVVEGASPAHHQKLLKGLKTLLVTIGDTSSVLMGIETADEEAQGKLKVVCRNNGSRKCPFLPKDETRLHSNNNAALYLMPTEKDHNYEVRYSCHSTRCKSGGGQVVGTISLQASGEWSGVSHVNTIGSISKRQRLEKPQDSGSAAGNGMDLETSGVDDSNGAPDYKMGEAKKQMPDMCEAQDHPMTDALDNVETYDSEYLRACSREVLLTAPQLWDSPETEALFAAYKAVCPDDNGGALREWCRRIPIYDDAEISDRFNACIQANHIGGQNPLETLHRLRCTHTVFCLKECPYNPLVTEKVDEGPTIEVSKLLGCIKGESCTWETFTRVARQLCPTARDRVVGFVERMYHQKLEDIGRLWDCGESFVSEDLAQFVRISTCNLKLISVVIPALLGHQVWAYSVNEDKTELTVELDCTPRMKKSLLLESGEFIGTDICIKLQNELFERHYADSALVDLLLETGQLTNMLAFDSDSTVNHFRIYQNSTNGEWKKIEESAALLFIVNAIRKMIMPTYHLQCFRERGTFDPSSNGSTIFPKSADVNQKINSYGERAKNTKEVLSLIKGRIERVFKSQPHHLGFSNGVVDLRDGTLIGRARPEWNITHSVPHPYDPNTDTTEITRVMQSFFPAACYPDGEHTHVLAFYQQWKGYSLTGETHLNKSLWLSGRGANGKSILSELDSFVWGRAMYGTLSMTALQKDGSTNNDFMCRVSDKRMVAIVENADNRKIDQTMFKKITGGDEIDLMGKYDKGQTKKVEFKMTFSLNDPPIWASADFAVQRRIWGLPMYAQFLTPGDDQRQVLEQQGKAHYIFDRDDLLLKTLKEQYAPAYMKWAVQGAVQYYANGQNIVPPRTVREADEQQAKDKLELFDAFIQDHLEEEEASQGQPCISTAEIIEAFLTYERLDTSIDSTTKNQLHQRVNLALTGETREITIFRYVKHRKLTLYWDRLPVTSVAKRPMGYVGVKWKVGPVAVVVNRIRSQYKGDPRPPILAKEVAPIFNKG